MPYVFEATRDPRAVDLLLPLLTSKKRGLPCGAAEALGNIKDRRAVPALINVLIKGKDEWIRSCAASALGNIGAADASAVETLLGALKDESPESRACAASALGQLKDPRAVEPLTSACALPVKRPLSRQVTERVLHKIQIAILNSLGLIGDPRAVDFLGSVWSVGLRRGCRRRRRAKARRRFGL